MNVSFHVVGLYSAINRRVERLSRLNRNRTAGVHRAAVSAGIYAAVGFSGGNTKRQQIIPVGPGVQNKKP